LKKRLKSVSENVHTHRGLPHSANARSLIGSTCAHAGRSTTQGTLSGLFMSSSSLTRAVFFREPSKRWSTVSLVIRIVLAGYGGQSRARRGGDLVSPPNGAALPPANGARRASRHRGNARLTPTLTSADILKCRITSWRAHRSLGKRRYHRRMKAGHRPLPEPSRKVVWLLHWREVLNVQKLAHGTLLIPHPMYHAF